MKIRKGRFSGTIGNEVFVNTKDGQIVRSRPSRPSRNTPDRERARYAMSRVANAWRTCTPRQFEAWAIAALRWKMKAYALFCKINLALAAAGLPLTMRPPKSEKLRPNPVAELDIRKRGRKITLRLWVPEAPVQYTFVLGSPPCSAGRSVRNNYCIIGLLPAAERGWSHITDLYVKRFGLPPPGSRIFIQTRQMIGGWEDDFKTTNAIVPRR